MISYELAKQLKDAGFPFAWEDTYDFRIQPEELKDKSYSEPLLAWIKEHHYKTIHTPSLSELIEACGDKFKHLSKNGSDTYIWEAVGITDKGYWGATGQVPEEAVAKLWMELNKKYDRQTEN